MYLVTKAPTNIKIKDKCNIKVSHLPLLNKLYLLMLPIKLKTKINIMASNHLALYAKIRAVSVLYSFSINVAIPITAANTMNSTAINRVDDKKEIILLIIIVVVNFEIAQKYLI